jgi:hypothetical protein
MHEEESRRQYKKEREELGYRYPHGESNSLANSGDVYRGQTAEQKDETGNA